jgi:hypothetical protein
VENLDTFTHIDAHRITRLSYPRSAVFITGQDIWLIMVAVDTDVNCKPSQTVLKFRLINDAPPCMTEFGRMLFQMQYIMVCSAWFAFVLFNYLSPSALVACLVFALRGSFETR